LPTLEQTVRTSLNEFAQFLSDTTWRGRERELISLYAFGFLRKHCKPKSVLHDPTQIGIEVAVPQIPRPNAKPQVSKDLVIWKNPGMTCWDSHGKPTRHPLAILEWKVGSRKGMKGDLKWLSEYSKERKGFVGFAIFCSASPSVSLKVTLVRRGRVTDGWLTLPRG